MNEKIGNYEIISKTRINGISIVLAQNKDKYSTWESFLSEAHYSFAEYYNDKYEALKSYIDRISYKIHSGLKKDVIEYGYTYSKMNLLLKSEAIEKFNAGEVIYLLYSDNTEAEATSLKEIKEFDGYFGTEDSKILSKKREDLER